MRIRHVDSKYLAALNLKIAPPYRCVNAAVVVVSMALNGSELF